ncbi:AAA family ATPase [Pseudonocardia sp. ICBG601]|uniref:AAA family ATPase n=1 Tax=Pseudonocardia sp. ICBG601 TaxID=2846759 RepID=UPI001CF6ED8B|nr:AAA family ATPase [Pseudonocardia sp. ICBG601]
MAAPLNDDDNVEQLPPADVQAERAVLGSAMYGVHLLDEAATVVAPVDFYAPAHGPLFAAMLAMRSAGQPVDAVTVAGGLDPAVLRAAGGAPYLHSCMEAAAVPSNVRYYAEIVADKAARRRLIDLGTRIRQLARVDVDAVADVLDRARKLLDDVPAGPRSAARRELRETVASDVVMRRQRWLWDGRIVVGGLTLLAGREGLGKSTVAVDLAAQVTRGTLHGEFRGHPRSVIYVHTEDARDLTIVPRLVAAGADLSRVIFLDAVTAAGHDAPLVLPTDTRTLAERITARDVALVVLDAATSVIDGALDGDRDRQMRQGLEPISRLAAETGTAVLGIVHFGKRESGDTGKLILGSIAWSQVARSVLAVARDSSTDDLVITATKANLAPGDAPSLAARLVPTDVPTDDGPTSVGRIEWTGETNQRAQDLLTTPTDGEERSLMDEAKIWLTGYLSDPQRSGSANAGDLLRDAQRDGYNSRLMQRARKQVDVTTERRDGHWQWTLDRASQGDTTVQGDKGSTS